MRFAEPVRGSGAELEALSRLVASGEVALTNELDAGDADADADADTEAAPASRPAPPAWNEGSEWGASFDGSTSDGDTLDGPEDEPEPDTERSDEPAEDS
jgi:hypothetical protein